MSQFLRRRPRDRRKRQAPEAGVSEDARIPALRHEIVKVVSDSTLYDSNFNCHTYRPGDGAPVLNPGYYLVLWPPGADPTRFDRNARFYGPFVMAVDAKHLVRHFMRELLEEDRGASRDRH